MSLESVFREKLLGQLSDDKTELDIDNAVRVADKFALGFAKWLRRVDTQENAEFWFGYSDEDMLDEYKKTL